MSTLLDGCARRTPARVGELDASIGRMSFTLQFNPAGFVRLLRSSTRAPPL